MGKRLHQSYYELYNEFISVRRKLDEDLNDVNKFIQDQLAEEEKTMMEAHNAVTSFLPFPDIEPKEYHREQTKTVSQAHSEIDTAFYLLFIVIRPEIDGKEQLSKTKNIRLIKSNFEM